MNKIKLNQVLAIESGERSRSKSNLTKLHRDTSRAELFEGFAKTYAALDEEGETFPDQRKNVEMEAEKALEACADAVSELIDIEAAKDWGNTSAKASVIVDGTTVLADAPVTFLLFLEKELDKLRKFVDSMPTLSSSVDWRKDDNSGMFRSEPVKTHKTKKVQRAIVLYDATEHHPAQTQLISEDEVVGHWSTVHFSGALPAPRKAEVLKRIDKLSKATKQAREEANLIEVERKRVAEDIFTYLFTP